MSGQSYDDYIAAHIFAPAHMTATGNQPETVILPHRATGYMKEAGKLVPADPTQPWRGTGQSRRLIRPWGTSAHTSADRACDGRPPN